MFSEKKNVGLLCTNTFTEGELYLYEEAPNENEKVLLELAFDDQKIGKTDNDFFSALQALRVELEKRNIQIMCNGSAENVYPSPMQMSMGSGRTAYLLELGKPAKKADIVDIFDCIVSLSFVSLQKQEAFYDKWLRSILKNN